jgi:Uma2 family endonuclease
MQAQIPSRVDVHDDQAVFALIRANPNWRLEFSREGDVLISPLVSPGITCKELEAAVQLLAWERHAGGRAFGASAGFRLRDGSLLGPDAAWISAERLASLPPEATKPAFWYVCPDVVVEVMSIWDDWQPLQAKIDRYITNGATYAVAIDHERRRVHECGRPAAGLQLDFERIFDA